jgi:hypothetical protein
MTRAFAPVAFALALAVVGGAPAAAAGTAALKAAPKQIAFGTRAVTDPGTDYYDGVRVTNSSRRTLRVVVAAGLPDDFGFGLMPGSTCPVFDTDPPMAAGESCRAVVRFTPTAFFAGSRQAGTLIVTARDPGTGELVASLEVPVTGTGRP